ncbi:MAG TPA: hypothetical protein VGE09_16520, partial [Pseudoxanthomonas sp.]
MSGRDLRRSYRIFSCGNDNGGPKPAVALAQNARGLLRNRLRRQARFGVGGQQAVDVLHVGAV